MNPELEKAIKERIELGYDQDRIAQELRAAGYDEATISHVYQSVAGSDTLVTTAIPSASTGQLIGYLELISASFKLLKQEWKLFLVSSVYGLIAFIIMMAGIVGGAFLLESQPITAVGLMITVGLSGVIALITFSMALQRALLLRTQQLPYIEHAKWCLKNLLGLILVALFVNFVTSLGQILLILPGIAFAVYLMFATFIRLEDRERKVLALVASTQLVYNRWWGTVLRLAFSFLVFGALSLVVIIPVILLWGVINVAGLSAPSFEIINAIVIPFVLGALYIFTLMLLGYCAMTVLYESLRSTVVTYTEEHTKKLRTWMIVGIILGIPAFLFLQAFNTALDDSQGETFDDFMSASQAELSVEEQAEFEAFLEEFGAELESIGGEN